MKQKDLAKYYNIPLTLKTKKETTGKKELEEIFFRTGDKILERVMELRSLDTNICIAPEARILTSSWEWIPAKDIQVGRQIIGFNEQLEAAYGTRQFVNTPVIKIGQFIKPRVRITTTKGQVICSQDHMWLFKVDDRDIYHWCMAKDLAIGGRISYFTDPWELDTSYEAGYIAGFLDGEGNISKGTVVRFGQTLGTTLDYVVNMLRRKGYKLTICEDGWGHANCYIGGNGYCGVRLVGSMRPNRLLEDADLTGSQINSRGIGLAVISNVEDIGDGEVIAIKTQSKTMVVEGYNSHNCNYLPNWKPSKRTGCVHTTFGFTAPSGQKDSRSPNVLNCSKHTVIGQLFRRIIEAPEGYVFVEFDKKSFHVGTMGYAAEDPSYIRFSQLDPHSIFTSHIMPKDWGEPVSMKWSDEDILARCKEIKKKSKQQRENDPKHGIDIRQDIAKPTVLGNQLGLGARKLYWMNRRFISGIKRAEELQEILGGLFPSVAKFKDFIREKAHQQTYLLLPEWGKIQYFYDVFNFTYNKRFGRWEKHPGTDSEKAIAFPVQGYAFGMIDDELIRIALLEGCKRFNFLLGIHDSLMFMPKKEDLDKCIEMVVGEMGKPCKRLVNKATGEDGLRIAVEVACGRNWQNHDKSTNPEGMQEIKI